MQELITLALEQMRNIWRFRWVALGMAWIIAVIGWLYAYSLPSRYSVDARVHIDTKSAIQPLLGDLAIKPDVSRQVALLIRTVKSGPHLKTIARQTGLDLQANTTAAEQSLIEDLRRNIEIRGQGSGTDLYRISYSGTDPETTHAVVQQTINIMTGMAADNNSNQDSGKAIQFLKQQVQNYRQRLDQTKRRLSTFKKNHAQLMQSDNGYVARLKQLNDDVDSIQNKMDAVKNRRQMLKDNAQGVGSTVIPASQTREVQRIDQQIQQKRGQISTLLSRYTPQHPDVVAAKSDLQRLQSKRQETLSRLQANPQQRTRQTGAAAQRSLQGRLDDLSIKMQSLQADLSRKRKDIEQLKAGSGKTTDAQAKLAELSRDYGATQERYQKLVNRLYTARLSQQVDSRNNPVKFQIVDPPEVPAKPSGPNRTILITLALFASMGAGVAFAFFLSQLRPVFINRRSLMETTGLPVLGTVSLARTHAQRFKRRLSLTAFVVGLATLLAGYAVAVLLAPIAVQLMPNLSMGQIL